MSAEHLKLLEYAAYGGVSALIASMVKNGRLQLPRIYVETGKDGFHRRYIDPGFLATVLFGALLAAAVDGRPYTAIAFGIASGAVGKALLRPFVSWAAKHLNVSISFGYGSRRMSETD